MWQLVVVLGAGLASMRAAMLRGDVDEAARQGAMAGPVVVERALASKDAATQLAGIAAAPIVEDRAELLEPLARVAATAGAAAAVPAASAGRAIALELAAHERADDVAGEDVAAWRAAWAGVALRADRPSEVRVAALEAAAALDPAGAGVPLDAAIADADPAFRRAAIAGVAIPAPPGARPVLAKVIAGDADASVALAAAQAYCAELAGDDARTAAAALGDDALARIRTLVAPAKGDSREKAAAARDAKRCLVSAPKKK